MSMVLKHVTVGTKSLPIIYNSNALFRLEEKTGLTTLQIGMLLGTRRAGFRILQMILWSGLESGRRLEKTRRDPYTIEEVGDLIDEVGGPAVAWDGGDDGLDKETKQPVRASYPPHAFYEAVLAAWKSVFDIPERAWPAAPANPPTAVSSPGVSESTRLSESV